MALHPLPPPVEDVAERGGREGGRRMVHGLLRAVMMGRVIFWRIGLYSGARRTLDCLRIDARRWRRVCVAIEDAQRLAVVVVAELLSGVEGSQRLIDIDLPACFLQVHDQHQDPCRQSGVFLK